MRKSASIRYSMPARPAGVAWQLLALSAAASVALQLAATVISFTTSSEDFRLAGALASGGFVMLRALVAWGVWNRARWALWAGGAIAFFTLFTVPVLARVRIDVADYQVGMTWMAVTIGWVSVFISAAFLTGLVLLRFGYRLLPAGQRLLRGILPRP